jgi:aspartyl-tRNA(Asn)/glutamyl-tRNA(Gln) amidotransferase subunit A
MTKPLNELTITEAGKGLRAKEFSVKDLFDACSTEAEKRNPELHAYLEIFDADEEAIASAQKRIDAGDAPALCGIPVAMKDNILIEGKVASSASKILSNHVATYDAHVTKKLKEAGALFVGRTNMDEFALGGSTENSAYGVTKNPHDTTRVAGGTSGGSAAAVAAHMAIAGFGTDTGGSLRNPASYCGVVGTKPTYGAVSRSGLIAAVSSFDQAGPLTKTVQDARIALETIRGYDEKDATSLRTLPSVSSSVGTIGVLSPHIEGNSFSKDTPTFKKFDESINNLSLPTRSVEHELIDASLAAYYIINFAEVSTNLARFDGIRYGAAQRVDTLLGDYLESRSLGFGPETKRRTMLGTYVLSSGYIDAFYRKADALRNMLRDFFTETFKEVDVIATPTMPTPAFVIGEKGDPISLYLEDVFTVMANLAGIPAISVPMGTVEIAGKQLPLGMQFMAPHGGEDRLFNIAAKVSGEAVY